MTYLPCLALRPRPARRACLVHPARPPTLALMCIRTSHCLALLSTHPSPPSPPPWGVYIPSIISPYAPHTDGLDRLYVQHAQVLGIYQREMLAVKVHKQILPLENNKRIVSVTNSNKNCSVLFKFNFSAVCTEKPSVETKKCYCKPYKMSVVNSNRNHVLYFYTVALKDLLQACIFGCGQMSYFIYIS